MKERFLGLLVLIAATSAHGQVDTNARATNQLYEQGPVNTIVRYQANAGYGYSRVLQVGDRVRMYTTGIEDFAAGGGDKVWLWENSNDWAGWNTPYTRAAAPLLPLVNCSGSTPYACRTDHNYSLHWAWHNPPETLNTKHYLIAGTGPTVRPNTHEWREVLIGESSDGGKSFKYKGLLTAANGAHFVKITWQPLLIDNIWRLFGYVDFKYHADDRTDGRSDQGLGAILFTPSYTAPFLIDGNARLEIWSGGAWKNVARCGTGSQYTFCVGFDTDPDLPPPFNMRDNRFPNLYKMARYGGALELWTSGGTTSYPCVCDRATGAQNVFYYFPVTTPVSRSQNPFSLIGPERALLQKATKIRCNPGSYSHSRKHPTRLEWTWNLIYSREFAKPEEISKECPAAMAGPYGWIIATQLATN